jgi:hypothetical protein
MAHKLLGVGVLLWTVSFSAAQTSGRAADTTFYTEPDGELFAGASGGPEAANNFISAPEPAFNPAPVEAIEPQTPLARPLYQPLSTGDKFRLAISNARSLDTFTAFLYEATSDQITGQWYHYGGGMQGWGKRLGATIADTESRRFIQTFLLSSIFHQDPRYFYSTQKNLVARAWYAASRVLITRTDRGRETLNSSELLGALFSTSLQNAYYPSYNRGLNETINRFTGALTSDATSKLIREFTPDFKRIFHKHEPERIREFQARLPKPIQQWTDF